MIISADQYNDSKLRTVTVVIVTSSQRLAAMPGNVVIPAAAAGLTSDSVVNVTQVATVDRDALETRVGALPAWLMTQVDSGLARALALGRR